MAAPDDSHDDSQRLDKWLWCVRLFKTRSQAADAISGGKVKVNGERRKPAYTLRPGDRLTLAVQDDPTELQVLALATRRGPASEARACYIESVESQQRKQANRELRQMAALSRPRPETKPDKRERRQMDRLLRDLD